MSGITWLGPPCAPDTATGPMPHWAGYMRPDAPLGRSSPGWGGLSLGFVVLERPALREGRSRFAPARPGLRGGGLRGGGRGGGGGWTGGDAAGWPPGKTAATWGTPGR